jgi:hypothetical protein
MPANRSRTERFQESFRQVCDRGGCLEFSIAPRDDAYASPDLVWRVRLLRVTETELVVERPTAAGRTLSILEGVDLIGALVIGQNRWRFRTRTLERATGQHSANTIPGSLRLAMPESVERCSRRENNRVHIASVNLPIVEVWSLLEPSSVVAAEEANRAAIRDAEMRPAPPGTCRLSDELALPVVGPRFLARLMNVGGGGLGLMVDKSEASAASRAKLVWLRVHLEPVIALPLGLTAKIVHTHVDSTQNLYAGLAFEFAFHQSHRDFVIEQIERYISRLQTPMRKAA